MLGVNVNVNVIPIENVNLSITTFRVVEGCFPSVSYSLLLEEGGISWMVERRFHEMEEFYLAICRTFHNRCSLPQFAPRTLIPSTNSAFLSARKMEMEKCLQLVLEIPDIADNQLVRDFFEFERADIVRRRDAQNKVRQDAEEMNLQDRETAMNERSENLAQREEYLKDREALLDQEEEALIDKLQSEERNMHEIHAQFMRETQEMLKKQAHVMKDGNDQWRKNVERSLAEKLQASLKPVLEEKTHALDDLLASVQFLVAENERLRQRQRQMDEELSTSIGGSLREEDSLMGSARTVSVHPSWGILPSPRQPMPPMHPTTVQPVSVSPEATSCFPFPSLSAHTRVACSLTPPSMDEYATRVKTPRYVNDGSSLSTATRLSEGSITGLKVPKLDLTNVQTFYQPSIYGPRRDSTGFGA